MSRAPDFESFMNERANIATAYVNGDAEPLMAIVTEEDPATFFPPKGPAQKGASVVSTKQADDAKMFGKGSTTDLEIWQQYASEDLAFWTGMQTAVVQMAKGGDPVKMKLRITEVFRREDGAWKLVHRHADMPETE